MGLAHAAGTINEKWIEGLLLRVLCNGFPHTARQLIAVALDEIVEVLLGVEVGLLLLRSGVHLAQAWTLVGSNGFDGLLCDFVLLAGLFDGVLLDNLYLIV